MTTSKFRLFLIKKLPIAFIAGVRLQGLSEESCETRVRLSWLNQNPFRSMFWAVQGMAAELSTGILCFEFIQNQKTPISMLVISQKAEFKKKAVGCITFQCKEGKKIADTITKAIKTGIAQTIEVQSLGTDENNDVVAEFEFTWSFKSKT